MGCNNCYVPSTTILSNVYIREVMKEEIIAASDILKGDSAYEVAVKLGYEGNEEEWLTEQGATIEQINITTGTAGTNASVVLNGSPKNRRLDLTIPRGDKGIQGEKGVKGDKGDKGDTGPKGDKGVDGSYTQKAYNTEALMIADKANIPANTSVDVTNDPTPSKNGTYSYNGTTFTKSIYDPLVQAKSYADTVTAELLADIKGKNINIPSLADGLWMSTTSSRWIASSETYSGKLLPVTAGVKYKITGNENGLTKIVFVMQNELMQADKPLVNVSPMGGLVLGSLETVVWTAPANAEYLWMSNKNSSTSSGTLNTLPSKISTVVGSLLYKDDITSSLTSGGDNTVLSAEAGKELSSKIEDIGNYLAPLHPISSDIAVTDIVAYQWRAVDVQVNSNKTVKSIEFDIEEGDILTFDYSPIEAPILWDWREYEATGKAFPLLTHTYTSDEVLTFEYRATNNLTLRLSNAIQKTVKVNGEALVDYTDLGLWLALQYPIKNTTYFTQAKSTEPFLLKKGQEVVVTKVGRGHMAVGYIPVGSSKYRPIYGNVDQHLPSEPYSWVADSDVQVVLTGTLDSEFLVRDGVIDYKKDSLESRLKNLDVDISKLAKDNYEVPDVLLLGKKTTVFATAMNYLLDTQVIDGVDHIRISTDLGKTYNVMPNILGDIVHCHFFSDGTIMLCSPTKVYWTDDYLTLNESVVYDHDGSVFVPTHRHFFAMQNSDKTMHIDGREIFAWGEYTITGVPRIWYSTDRGRTIKCAAKFGTTVMDGKTRKIRHVHRVSYREKDSSFYITTGDHGYEGNENMVLRANYDFDTDEWTWKFYNSGWNYKFGAIFFDDVYAYLLTDYTNPDQQDIQGFYRVLPEHLGDFSKYRAIYKPDTETLGETAFSRFFMDRMGNKVILPDWKGFGVIWVAREGMDFKRVQLSKNIWLAYIIGANYNGDIYSVEFDNFIAVTANGGANIKLNRGTYNITEAMRNSGVNDFMRGHTLINDMGSISEQP